MMERNKVRQQLWAHTRSTIDKARLNDKNRGLSDLWLSYKTWPKYINKSHTWLPLPPRHRPRDCCICDLIYFHYNECLPPQPRLSVVRCVSQVTLEPLVFLHGLANRIGSFTDDQMILYKICRGRNHFNIKVLNITHSCVLGMNDSVFGMESFQRRNSIWQGSSAPTLRSTQTPVSTRRWSRRSSALTTSSPSPTTSFPSSCLSTSAAGVTSLDGSPSSASTWLVELSQPWQTSSTPSTWRSGVNGCGWPLWCRLSASVVAYSATSLCCSASLLTTQRHGTERSGNNFYHLSLISKNGSSIERYIGKKDQSFPNSTYCVMFSSLYKPVVYTIFTEWVKTITITKWNQNVYST